MRAVKKEVELFFVAWLWVAAWDQNYWPGGCLSAVSCHENSSQVSAPTWLEVTGLPVPFLYSRNTILLWNTNTCSSWCLFLILMTIKYGCSSPYDGKWSKTMVGYGPEDNHFVAELTYNYGIGEYRLGNDFLVSTTLSSKIFLLKISFFIFMIRSLFSV